MRRPTKPTKPYLRKKPSKTIIVESVKQLKLGNGLSFSKIRSAIVAFYASKGVTATESQIKDARLIYSSYGYRGRTNIKINVRERNAKYEQQLEDYNIDQKKHKKTIEEYNQKLVEYEERMLTYSKWNKDKEEVRLRTGLEKAQQKVEEYRKRVLRHNHE